jgi:hypothetical protein
VRAAWIVLLVSACSGFQANPGMPDLAPAQLAGGLVLPIAVAVNDRHVYWLEWGPQHQGLEGSLSRVDKLTGCAQADAGCVDGLTDMRFLVLSLALGPDDACWLESYDDMRQVICMSLTTGQVRRLTENQPFAFGLFSDGESLYWVNGGDNGSIVRNPFHRNSPMVLVSGRNLPTSVSSDGDGLYWTEDMPGAVWAAGREGEAPHTVATGLSGPRSVRPHGEWLYFTEEKAGKVGRVKKDGSAVEVLADGLLNPIDLTVDDGGVHVVAMGTPPNHLDGEVLRLDRDGQHRRVIADHQHYLSGLTVDGEWVYWIAEGTEAANYLDGALWRATR